MRKKVQIIQIRSPKYNKLVEKKEHKNKKDNFVITLQLHLSFTVGAIM